MAITISEIAKLANVSKTTVSYVLNGKGNIPASTRDKVLKIMQEHDYQPNNNARNLSIGKMLGGRKTVKLKNGENQWFSRGGVTEVTPFPVSSVLPEG